MDHAEELYDLSSIRKTSSDRVAEADIGNTHQLGSSQQQSSMVVASLEMSLEICRQLKTAILMGVHRPDDLFL